MIARVKDQRRGAARAGQGAAMKFWEFPFGVEVEAPDTAIEELERLARLFAGANWGMEFDCTAMHFASAAKNTYPNSFLLAWLWGESRGGDDGVREKLAARAAEDAQGNAREPAA
jgi:hypothetical protein